MSGLAKTAWVELKLFSREPLTVIFTLALPLVLLWVLGGVFGNQPDPRVYRGVGPMDYYVPAYVALVLASIGLIGLPVHLAAYREHGVLRRFRASTVPVRNVFGAQIAVTIVIAVAGSILLGVASAITYHVAAPVSLPGVVATFLLGAVTFAAIGLLLGVALPTARAAQGAGVMAWFLMLFLGGTGPPPEVLNDTLGTVSRALPLHYVVRMIQSPWLGIEWDAADVLASAGFLVAALVLAGLVYRARRTR